MQLPVMHLIAAHRRITHGGGGRLSWNGGSRIFQPFRLQKKSEFLVKFEIRLCRREVN
jgi:hypothetical protein